jgi:HAD superfamily hydrolase (TIGR01662 family)
VSLRAQAGNADDALMDRLHGRGWRARASAPRGALRRHVAVTTAAASALALAAPVGPRSRYRRAASAVAAATWALGTAAFAWRRIAPGPRDLREVAAMVATSVAIPPVAVWHRVRGEVRAHRLVAPSRPAAVLFDRDGTLIHDVPYNGDPAAVVPVPGALGALARLRRAGVPVGLVTNQSGVARGLLTLDQVQAVNARVADLLGPFDVTVVCPHGADDGCDCRKPRPGMVRRAASRLGVPPERCALVGDIGSDVGAALAAGARPILVPTDVTRADEVAAAPEVAADLAAAVDLLLGAP